MRYKRIQRRNCISSQENTKKKYKRIQRRNTREYKEEIQENTKKRHKKIQRRDTRKYKEEIPEQQRRGWDQHKSLTNRRPTRTIGR